MWSICNFFCRKNFSDCRVTRQLFCICAIQSICGGIGFYITLFLKHHTTLDMLQIGTLVSAISIGNILGSSLGGYISDKKNPSDAIKKGLIIQGFSLFLLIFVTNFYITFFVMLFMGMGSYCYATASHYVLNSKFDNQETRAQIIAAQHIVSNAGMFLAAILMGYCAAGHYLPIFLTVSLCLILIGIMLKPFDKLFYSAQAVQRSIEKPSQAFGKLYLVGLFGVILIGIIYSQHRVGYPIFLSPYFGAVSAGYLMAINPLIILLFQSSIIKKCSKFNEIFLLGIGLLFFGISFFILNVSMSLLTVFASCITMTFGEILGLTYAQSIAFGYAPSSIKGRILGLYKSIFSITKLMGVYLASLLLLGDENYSRLWNFSGFLGLLGFLIAILIIVNQKKQVKKFLLS